MSKETARNQTKEELLALNEKCIGALVTEIKAQVTNVVFRVTLKLKDESMAYIYAVNHPIDTSNMTTDPPFIGMLIPGPRWAIHIQTEPLQKEVEEGPESKFKPLKMEHILPESEGFPFYYHSTSFLPIVKGTSLHATHLNFGLEPECDNLLILEFRPYSTTVAAGLYIKDGTENAEVLKRRVEEQVLTEMPPVAGVQ